MLSLDKLRLKTRSEAGQAKLARIQREEIEAVIETSGRQEEIMEADRRLAF